LVVQATRSEAPLSRKVVPSRNAPFCPVELGIKRSRHVIDRGPPDAEASTSTGYQIPQATRTEATHKQVCSSAPSRYTGTPLCPTEFQGHHSIRSQTQYSKLAEDRGSRAASRISLAMNTSQFIQRDGFCSPGGAHPPTAAPPLAVPTPQGGDSSKRTGCYDVMATPSSENTRPDLRTTYAVGRRLITSR
jgi:hypothetical protein